MSQLVKHIKKTTFYRSFRKSGKNIRKNIKRFLLKRKLDKAPPVFIYQMGKVASSSIYHSLKSQYPGAVGAAHHIGGENWQSELLYNVFKRNKPIKVISIVREPIGRNISDFFELFVDYAGIDFKESNLTIDELISLFIDKYRHDWPLTWFDNNIFKYFGIDVYKTHFPCSGIANYSLNNVELLVLRIELSDSSKEKAIQSFLSLKSFRLHNLNLSTNKEYRDTYKIFKDKIRLPESYLLKMKKSKYFNHFYSTTEISQIISKWE